MIVKMLLSDIDKMFPLNNSPKQSSSNVKVLCLLSEQHTIFYACASFLNIFVLLASFYSVRFKFSIHNFVFGIILFSHPYQYCLFANITSDSA